MKSTVIRDGLALLLFDVSLDNLIGNIAGAYRQISASPDMPTPKLAPQMCKLREQYSGAYPLQPLHDLTHILRRTIGDEHMDVVFGNLPRDNLKLMLHCNLAQDIPHPDSHLARQHSLPVFGDPNHMNFQVCLCMCTGFIKSHGDNFKLFFALRRGVSTIADRDTN